MKRDSNHLPDLTTLTWVATLVLLFSLPAKAATLEFVAGKSSFAIGEDVVIKYRGSAGPHDTLKLRSIRTGHLGADAKHRIQPGGQVTGTWTLRIKKPGTYVVNWMSFNPNDGNSIFKPVTTIRFNVVAAVNLQANKKKPKKQKNFPTKKQSQDLLDEVFAVKDASSSVSDALNAYLKASSVISSDPKPDAVTRHLPKLLAAAKKLRDARDTISEIANNSRTAKMTKTLVALSQAFDKFSSNLDSLEGHVNNGDTAAQLATVLNVGQITQGILKNFNTLGKISEASIYLAKHYRLSRSRYLRCRWAVGTRNYLLECVSDVSKAD